LARLAVSFALASFTLLLHGTMWGCAVGARKET
jgi:hypothetical protein